MRVVFVLPGYAFRPIGGYNVVYDYAEYLADSLGLETHVLYFPHELGTPGVSVFRRFRARLRQGSLHTLVRGRRGRDVNWREPMPLIRSHLWRLSFGHLGLTNDDVVVATAPQTAHFVAEAVRLYGAKGAYFLQHVEDWSVGSEFLQATYRLPLKLVAVAPWIREYVMKTTGRQCEVVLNGVDALHFPRGPELVHRRSVGALLSPSIPHKRSDVAIEVLNEVSRRGIPCHSFGTCERPPNLSKDVLHVFDPSHEELVKFYQESRVFICTSSTEGFGLTPAEASLCGAAVVSTRNGGVEAYGEGFVTFCGNAVEEIVAAVLEVFSLDEGEQERVNIGIGRLADYSPGDAARAFAEFVTTMTGGESDH